MGSFSELVMSFPLRQDVDDEVLAAFASIAVPHPDAPSLPPAPPGTWYESSLDYEPDCDLSAPWSHDWGSWLGAEFTNAYIQSDHGATMVWRHGRWVVTSRATWKAHPEEFVANLAVLGTVIDAVPFPEYDWAHGFDPAMAEGVTTGFFVGYVRYESEPRPWLLWADGSTLLAEDLNPQPTVHERRAPRGSGVQQLRKTSRARARRSGERSGDESDGGSDTGGADPSIGAAIRRTLERDTLYFTSYTIGPTDVGWSGSKSCGWWLSADCELYTEVADRHGMEIFAPNFNWIRGRESARCSLIRGGERLSWHRIDPSVSDEGARCSARHVIETTASRVAELLDEWRSALEDTGVHEFVGGSIPDIEATPIDVLTALLNGPLHGRETKLSDDGRTIATRRYEYEGEMPDADGSMRSGPWSVVLWLDDEFVSGARLRSEGHQIFFGLGHADFQRPKHVVPAHVPDPHDVTHLQATGSEVVMPAHPFEIDGEVSEGRNSSDFSVLVGGPDRARIEAALRRAALRIGNVTRHGRELSTNADRALAREFGIHVPGHVIGPRPCDDGFVLSADWAGLAGPTARAAGLAVVTQELLAEGVTDASLSS